MSLEPDEDLDDAELCCDSCGAIIQPNDIYWTKTKGEVLCENCIPPSAAPIGVRH